MNTDNDMLDKVNLALKTFSEGINKKFSEIEAKIESISDKIDALEKKQS